MLIYVLFHSPGVYGEQPIEKVLSGSTDVYDVGKDRLNLGVLCHPPHPRCPGHV